MKRYSVLCSVIAVIILFILAGMSAFAVTDNPGNEGTLVYDMTPVYPEDVKEGTYTVDTISSSQFFKITDAQLTRSDGKMKAVITISSTSYAYIYPGTADEAASAAESEWIPADESTGFGRFTLDVPYLNKEMPCAAFSKKKHNL